MVLMRRGILFLLAFLFSIMALSLLNNHPHISGFATEVISTERAEFKEEMDAVVSTLRFEKSLKYLGENSDICIVIEEQNRTYSYDMKKINDSVDISEAYCAAPNQNNVIIKFNSYKDLLDSKSKPRWFIKERRNTGYYIFPSNYVLQGGEINCTADFQQKYCGVLYSYLSSSEMSSMGLGCCASHIFTPAGLAYTFDVSVSENIWTYVILFTGIIVTLLVLSRKKKKH